MDDRSRTTVSLIALIGQLVFVLAGPWLGAIILPDLDLRELVTWQAYRPALGARPGERRQRRVRRRKQSVAVRPRPEESGVEDGVRSDEGAVDGLSPPAVVLTDPECWGLSAQMCAQLPANLMALWKSSADCFRTQTRDTSVYAYHYYYSCRVP